MKNLRLAIIPLASLAFAAAALPAPPGKVEQSVLVDKGKTAAAIVISQNGSPYDRRAAEILQASIRKMSGAVLPILEKRKPGRKGEIDIGFAKGQVPKALSSAAAPLKEDGFLVASSGKNLYVLSGGRLEL